MGGLYYVERVVTWDDEYFSVRTQTTDAWLVRASTPIEAEQKAARSYGDDEESFLVVTNNSISQMPNEDGDYNSYRAWEINLDAGNEIIELF